MFTLKQMTARLKLFLSGLWYCVLCQFWEYEVSYDDDDDVLEMLYFPVRGTIDRIYLKWTSLCYFCSFAYDWRI